MLVQFCLFHSLSHLLLIHMLQHIPWLLSKCLVKCLSTCHRIESHLVFFSWSGLLVPVLCDVRTCDVWLARDYHTTPHHTTPHHTISIPVPLWQLPLLQSSNNIKQQDTCGWKREKKQTNKQRNKQTNKQTNKRLNTKLTNSKGRSIFNIVQFNIVQQECNTSKIGSTEKRVGLNKQEPLPSTEFYTQVSGVNHMMCG